MPFLVIYEEFLASDKAAVYICGNDAVWDFAQLFHKMVPDDEKVRSALPGTGPVLPVPRFIRATLATPLSSRPLPLPALGFGAVDPHPIDRFGDGAGRRGFPVRPQSGGSRL